MKDIKPKIVILSAFTSGLPYADNCKNHIRLKRMLTDCKLPFKTVKGFYKGDSETSLVVTIKTLEDLRTVESFAFKNFYQDSILYSDSDRNSSIITKDGEVHSIGKLQIVPKSEALSHEYFTYDPINKTYWICK